MAKEINPLVEEKHKAIYQEYIAVVSSHGAYGPRLPKMDLYAEVAEKFFLTPNTVGLIVRKQLKNSK